MEPIYLQIASQLRAELSGYETGDYLPGELPLAKRFGVNRHTVRQALEVLAQEGYVLRVQGKGTQVLEAPLRYLMVEQSSYSNWFNTEGHASEARLLGLNQRVAEGKEIELLVLEADAEVIQYSTLRLVKETPTTMIRHVFSAKHKDLLSDYKKGSMRQYLRERGQVLTRDSSLIGARMPTSQESSRLKMPKNRPVLTVQTISKNQDNEVFELAFSVSRADRLQYHIVT